MTKIAGSGSISQRHGSADPDTDPNPYQNVLDPQHCFIVESTALCRLWTVFLNQYDRRNFFSLSFLLCVGGYCDWTQECGFFWQSRLDLIYLGRLLRPSVVKSVLRIYNRRQKVIFFSFLKVPKREIFDRSDFPDFYTIKSSWVGDLLVKILTFYFNFWES